jgi:ATP-dependent Clp protease ATP-binding subunit ClpB
MDINKLTQRAQEAVLESQNLALKHNHQTIEGEHLHFAIISQNDGLIPKLLSKMNIPFDFYYKDLTDLLLKIPEVYGTTAASPYVSRRFEELFVKAEDIAKKFQDEYISVEHIYLSLIDETNTPSAKLIRNME